MSSKESRKQPRKQVRLIKKRSPARDSDRDDSENAESGSDAEASKKKEIDYANVWSEDNDSEDDAQGKKERSDWAVSQKPSPSKRKRSLSMDDFSGLPDESDAGQTPASLNEMDLADLGDSEDDLDIERFEGEHMIQEEEDRRVLQTKFNIVDQAQPFAYAPDEESDRASNSEEFWIEDFDALVGGGAIFENTAVSKFQLAPEETEDAQLEEEFFLGYMSSDDGNDTSDAGDINDESPFGNEDEDDRVGWECFFSDGSSQADEEDADNDSEGGTTDDETPAVILARHKAANAVPVTPAKIPGKTNLTSCLKQTHVFNEETPSKSVGSTPIKLNTSHQPPVLGTWTRDSRRPTGIIDGLTTHSPVGQLKGKPKLPQKTTEPYRRSDAMNEAMTSLDDIMYTNDFLVPQPKVVPSKFDRPIQVGAFRKGQQRSSMIREDSFRDEWYNMTSRNKEKPGRTKATPILGVASESLSRKEKRRRKKMRAAAGMSVGGSTFGGSIDEQSDNDYNDGVERAGLGLGVPVESLFLFHDC